MRDVRVRGHAASGLGACGAALAACLIASGCAGHAAAHTSAAVLPGVCAHRPPYPLPAASRPRYRLTVQIPRRGPVRGTLAVAFTPDLGTGRLVFRLWPNGPLQAREGAHLAVSGVRLGGRPVTATLPDPTTLVIRSGGGFAAGQTVLVSMRFRLRLPGVVADRLARVGSALRMGSFFPIMPWEPGVGWDTDPPTTSLAETSSSPTADFAVRVRVPAGLAAVATGVQSTDGEWQAHAVRDFALAVGRFQTATALAHAPGRVRVVVAVARGVAVSPGAVAAEVRGALGSLSRRFGPYPWPDLHVAVMPGQSRLGIEYPTMIFLGTGTAGALTTHEVAHQWFYSLVGNDQARDPVLDEGLATYAMGASFPGVPVVGRLLSRTGEPMTLWDRLPYRDYQLGVYVEGARAVRSLGPDRLVDCALRAYVARNAYGIATQAGLVAALRSVVPNAPARLRRFGIPHREG
ncbi:MAG TPA: hypothetical protein VGI72_05490 [Gaiellales bacterium]